MLGSKVWWMHYRDRNGIRRRESSGMEDWQEHRNAFESAYRLATTTRYPLYAGGERTTFGQWADICLETLQTALPRAEDSFCQRRHLKHLRTMFETTMLADIIPMISETYLRRRLKARVVVQTKNGPVEKGVLKTSTVHQELRVLRRMLNVGVRKKLLAANPCARRGGLPAKLAGLFRPHYELV